MFFAWVILAVLIGFPVGAVIYLVGYAFYCSSEGRRMQREAADFLSRPEPSLVMEGESTGLPDLGVQRVAAHEVPTTPKADFSAGNDVGLPEL